MTDTKHDADLPTVDLNREADRPGVSSQDAEMAVGPETGLWGEAWQVLRRSPKFVVPAIIALIMVVMAIFPEAFTWFYPGEQDPTIPTLSESANIPGTGRPDIGNDLWFGRDVQGYDYYARTIHGASVSIAVGVLVTLGSTFIAIVFGSIAGYYGGFLDTLIARVTDISFAIPTILGGIVFLSVVDGLPEWIPIIDDQRDVWEVALVLTLFGWPSMLRLMRSSVLANREADYVLASKALGARDSRLIITHIIPNSLAPVIVYATIFVGVIISAEATLSFLGIGVQLPSISWGLSLNQASPRIAQAPHLLVFPGLFLSITVLSFIMMGDALRDALDPKLR